MSDTPKDKDYKVGYGKPPTERQFKPGQSGNPAGRPKGRVSVKRTLEKLGAEEIEIKTNGELVRVPMMEAVILSLYLRAIKSDNRAAQMLFDLDERMESLEDLGLSMRRWPPDD